MVYRPDFDSPSFRPSNKEPRRGLLASFAEAAIRVFEEQRSMRRTYEYEKFRHEETRKRVALLNPNENSDVKIEAYVFSLVPSQFAVGVGLQWGQANGFTAFKNPQVAFRAERLFVNVAGPGLAYLNTIQAANVNAQIGSIADAFSFSPLAVGSKISLPTLPPQNTMQVTGTWSAHVDTEFRRDYDEVRER
jgi:hypothetical protein